MAPAALAAGRASESAEAKPESSEYELEGIRGGWRLKVRAPVDGEGTDLDIEATNGHVKDSLFRALVGIYRTAADAAGNRPVLHMETVTLSSEKARAAFRTALEGKRVVIEDAWLLVLMAALLHGPAPDAGPAEGEVYLLDQDGRAKPAPWADFEDWKTAGPDASHGDPVRPRILDSPLRRVRELEGDVSAALVWLNHRGPEPVYFSHLGVPSRLDRQPPDLHGRERPVRFLPLDEREALLREYNERLDCYRRTVDSETGGVLYAPTDCPARVVRHRLGDARWAGLPEVDRLITSPVLGATGEVIATPGYHPDHGLYYAPTDLELPWPIPEAPDAAAVAQAREVIEDILCDFPFAQPAGKTHAVGAMLLPFLRALIAGPTPLHLIHKPTPGTGGTLLADTIAYPALGAPPAVLSLPADEESQRKVITAALMEGPVFILMDNLSSVRGAPLAAALTPPGAWSDRLLGHSRMVSRDVQCCWLASGNNPELSGEHARRVVSIRLDTGTDRPDEGRTFRYPRLRERVRQQRGALVWSCLVLARAWVTAGKPPSTAPTMASFESWAEVVGGVLTHAGYPAFLAPESAETLNREGEESEFRTFVERWWGTHQEAVVTVRELRSLAVEAGVDLSNTRGFTGDEAAQARQLGYKLRANRDGSYGGRALRLAARNAGWYLEPADAHRVAAAPSRDSAASRVASRTGGHEDMPEHVPHHVQAPLLSGSEDMRTWGHENGAPKSAPRATPSPPPEGAKEVRAAPETDNPQTMSSMSSCPPHQERKGSGHASGHGIASPLVPERLDGAASPPGGGDAAETEYF
jgi:hypothetical protein